MQRQDHNRNLQTALAALALLVLACSLPAPPLLTPIPFPPTATPAATPTATPTPSPTPTPTPLPSDLLRLGQEALFVGDDEEAARAFQAASAATADEAIAAQALLGLGQSHLAGERHAEAAVALQELLARYPASSQAHQAHFFLAEALAGSGDTQTAVAHYQAYLEGGTAIPSYLYERIGETLWAGGDYTGTVAAYEAAIAATDDLSFQVGLREKLALVHTAWLNFDAALAQYGAILERAQIDDYRARIAHQMAQTYLLADRLDEGYALHQEVVYTYPTSPWAYESLVVLVEAGIPVDDRTRGIVDYYGGAYGPAVTALYRYIESNADHLGDAHYYAAMAHLKAGSPALAASQFQVLVETHPESTFWGDGWMGWAEALRQQGDLEGAVATYRAFATAAPAHARAPEALWTAAQLMERSGDLVAAAEAYGDCQAAFPGSDYAAASLLRAGLLRYRLGDLEAAIADWQTLGAAYPASTERPASLFWLGKAYLAAGQPLSATAAFSQTVQTNPLGYYGLRAADLLADPLAEPFPVVGYVPLQDPAADQAAAEDWLASWLGLSGSEGIGELDATLAADPRLQRGLELWGLGWREEAKAELEALRRATVGDALAQYRLALFFRDLGLYRSSILAANNVIRLSPAATPLDAPPFLARLAYPVYYQDLVLSNALAENLPPLLVFALIRQESLFEGFATSSAYAHGLMQVIPSTGASIAAQLGWPPGYETADLYRPLVSVRFGTWYLARQRDAFDGRLDVALAAYNGGPGNAARWLESDPDLFFEAITLSETQSYLRLIREHYAVYAALYGQ